MQVLANAMVVNFLQYVNASNQHIVFHESGPWGQKHWRLLI